MRDLLKVLCIVPICALVDCKTGTQMRLHVKGKIKSSKNLAIVIPDARVFYTTRTAVVPNGDPFESFVDQGPVNRPQYAKIYANLRRGLEQGFGVKTDLFEPQNFRSNFVFSKNNTNSSFHETDSFPHEFLATARKYDMFIVVKFIERYDCFSYPKDKIYRYRCKAWLEVSLNNFEWANDENSFIRRVNRDEDKSFFKYGDDNFLLITLESGQALRPEEARLIEYQERVARVQPGEFEAAAEQIFIWGREFGANVMAEPEGPAQ